MHTWKQAPSSSNENDTPILILWINNIFENLKKSKNKFSYDEYIQQFSLLLFILGGRNCYEFLRLNLPRALRHVSNVELLMKKQDIRIVECNFRFDLLRDYRVNPWGKYHDLEKFFFSSFFLVFLVAPILKRCSGLKKPRPSMKLGRRPSKSRYTSK